MKKTLKVKVQEYHIENGKRESATCCPIALAVTALLPAFHVAEVTLTTVDVRNRRAELKCMVPLPDHAIRWIERFDSKRPVEPFGFELEIDL